MVRLPWFNRSTIVGFTAFFTANETIKISDYHGRPTVIEPWSNDGWFGQTMANWDIESII